MQMFIKPGEVVEQREYEAMQDFIVCVEKAAIFHSLENLMTFPFARGRVQRGDVYLHGASISASPRDRCSCWIRRRRSFAASRSLLANSE